MNKRILWITISAIAVLLLTMAFTQSGTVAAQEPATVVMTVDLSGTWNRDITVQLWTSDGATMKWSYGNQHGAVRTYNVPAGIYDLKLIQGPEEYLVDNLDCSNGCDAGVLKQTLTVDLSGAWNRDITVQLYKDGGGLIWSVGNQHGAVRTYNVLPGTYDLKLVEGDQVAGCAQSSTAPAIATRAMSFPTWALT